MQIVTLVPSLRHSTTSCHYWYQNILAALQNDIATLNIIYHLLKLKATVKLSLCAINYALNHEGVRRSGCIDPHFLALGSSWRWVVSFTLRVLYPWGKSPRYPLDRRLGGPQSLSERGENFYPTGTRTPTPRSSNPQTVAVPTAPPRFLVKSKHDSIYKTQRGGISVETKKIFRPTCRDSRDYV
jgi:hypothetical protein